MKFNAPIVEPLRGFGAADVFIALRSLPHTVWLDSVVREPRGRFSVVAADPVLVVTAKRSTVRYGAEGFEAVTRANPFNALTDWLDRVGKPSFATRPCPPGAAIGYFGYELKNHLERLPQRAVDDLRLPDMFWGIYDVLLVFDHERDAAWLVSTGLTPRGERNAAKAGERARQFRGLLQAGASSPLAGGSAGKRMMARFSSPRSNFTHEQYLSAVQRAKHYIAMGEIYQVNLSQRFECTSARPLDAVEQTALYLRLRQTNPAPFAAFLDIGSAVILSSSPECFLDISGRAVRTFPIKGTRPRGASSAEDARLARALLQSEKDRAELLMIVDLERNDLGRVCEFGTVRVPELARVESYATVHHLVATVEGTLREGVSHCDCIRACFPGGSITGAPKIRAMEIVDELEPHARGVYTGAIGMLGLPDADGYQQTTLNIAIRTVTLTGGRALFHAGGGIVADSDPQAEYEETLHKARGMMRALE